MELYLLCSFNIVFYLKQMVSVLLLLGVTSVASAVNTACTFQSNTDYSHGGDRVQTPAVSIVELQLRHP